MTTMPAAWDAKEALLAALCRPLLLDLSTNGHQSPLTLSSSFQFKALPDAPGFELARLVAPTGYSATLLRGEAGAHAPVFSNPHAVRLEVLAGKLRWWQETFGPQENNDAYRNLERGDILHLDPNERHTYRAIEAVLTYNLLSPEVPTK